MMDSGQLQIDINTECALGSSVLVTATNLLENKTSLNLINSEIYLDLLEI